MTVQLVYEPAPEPSAALTDAALTMDLGLDNLATCVNSTDGSSFLIGGKSVRSINLRTMDADKVAGSS